MNAVLLQALNRFEEYIESDSKDLVAEIRDAVRANPKIAYYISKISVSVSRNKGIRSACKVQYKNTDFPQSDIHIASSNTDVHSILCQYIGNYKTRLVIVESPGVDVMSEYDRFDIVNAVFYSNFIAAEISGVSSSLCPMPFYEFSFDYRIGKVKLKMMRDETNAEVSRISKQLFLPGMSAEAKAFLAHNYLAYTIDYTLVENASSLERSYMQSAYGALIKKKCVCQGYAEAFKQLMDSAGIPCDIVCGKTKGSDTYHAWNIIKLNGETDNYHIDVTWDSTGGRVSYKYFGLKDSDFSGKRTWNKEFNVKCSSPKNLLLEARRGVMRFKALLIKNGVDPNMLGY